MGVTICIRKMCRNYTVNMIIHKNLYRSEWWNIFTISEQNDTYEFVKLVKPVSHWNESVLYDISPETCMTPVKLNIYYTFVKQTLVWF